MSKCVDEGMCVKADKELQNGTVFLAIYFFTMYPGQRFY